MPVVRNSLLARRRSSHQFFTPAKPGVYGIGGLLPQRPISFAPNVTPVTFLDGSDSSKPGTPEPNSPNGDPSMGISSSSAPRLFPPSEVPAPPATRKRCPPGKRRSQGYIPRPPNAFMLFRADFVRQKHVPGSIETNHGSLSKIIGNCWRSLPLEEKKVWEQKAKHEKAAHKIQYPNYRFRPVHNKNKNKAKDQSAPHSDSRSASPRTAGSSASFGRSVSATSHGMDAMQSAMEEEIRCEEVTQLLLEGKKGEELARALRELDERKRKTRMWQEQGPLHPQHLSAPQPIYPSNGSTPLYLQRRPSSVPLPNYADYYMDTANLPMSSDSQFPHQQQSSMISLPSVPFLPPPSSAGITGLVNGSLDSVGDNFLRGRGMSIFGGAFQRSSIDRHRRSSSAGPAFGGMSRNWEPQQWSYGNELAPYGDSYPPFSNGYSMGEAPALITDTEPLPEVNMSLFDPGFLNGNRSTSGSVNGSDIDVPPTMTMEAGPGSLGPLDTTGLMNAMEAMNGMEGMVSPHDLDLGPNDIPYWQHEAHEAASHSAYGSLESSPSQPQTDLEGSEHQPQSIEGVAAHDVYGMMSSDVYSMNMGVGYVEC